MTSLTGAFAPDRLAHPTLEHTLSKAAIIHCFTAARPEALMDPVLPPLSMATSTADSFFAHLKHHTSPCSCSDCLEFARSYSNSARRSSPAQLSLCL